jgi:16S rRNA (adenine1518-N6/adenine1519-N6)-dimethyltransferase
MRRDIPGRAARRLALGVPIWPAQGCRFRPLILWWPMAPRLKKSLGQHHLRRPEACRPLLEFLLPQGERVLEIGPGGGALSGELLAAGARVVWAVELDAAWAFSLRRRSGHLLQPVVADALDLPFASLPAPTLLAGNLPYNVATALIARVLPLHQRVPRAAFLVQKEVAARLAAGPGGRAYGSLSVWAASHARVRILGTVLPGAFRPPPKVESAFVGFELRPPPLPGPEMEAFQRLVRQGFAHKRKTLRNSLGAALGRERAEAVLCAAGLDPGARAETVGLEAWLELYRVVRAGK